MAEHHPDKAQADLEVLTEKYWNELKLPRTSRSSGEEALALAIVKAVKRTVHDQNTCSFPGFSNAIVVWHPILSQMATNIHTSAKESAYGTVKNTSLLLSKQALEATLGRCSDAATQEPAQRRKAKKERDALVEEGQRAFKAMFLDQPVDKGSLDLPKKGVVRRIDWLDTQEFTRDGLPSSTPSIHTVLGRTQLALTLESSPLEPTRDKCGKRRAEARKPETQERIAKIPPDVLAQRWDDCIVIANDPGFTFAGAFNIRAYDVEDRPVERTYTVKVSHLQHPRNELNSERSHASNQMDALLADAVGEDGTEQAARGTLKT
jgi:hypothetical protein